MASCSASFTGTLPGLTPLRRLSQLQRRINNRKTCIRVSSKSKDVSLELLTVESTPDGSFLFRFGHPSDAPPPAASQQQQQQPQKESEASSSNTTAAASTPDTSKANKKFRSSWDAKEAVPNQVNPDADYLYQLGKTDNNININTGQNSQFLDTVFTGNFLGKQSDLADGSLRKWEFRSFNNLVGDYYIAPRFLDTCAMHITKNYLVATGALDSTAKCPLILGIWGGKGQGKTFQTELAFKKMGVEAVVMSAGELEHEWAGTPAKLIRERYRKAAEMSKVRGTLTCLLINDIDAGLGHFENTQVTVNNQMVVGTLMNICDNPTRVPLYGVEWRDNDEIRRTPIIVTGNDFSRIFAPLIRDGRMTKFYWMPTREDKQHILHQMYKDDKLSFEDMGLLLDRYPHQTLDFYGAIRASTYDGQIREWIKNDVIQGEIVEENENLKELGRRLAQKDNLPTFEPVDLTIDMLFAEGDRLVNEQELVMNTKLSDQYLKKQKKLQRSMIGLQG